MRIAVFGICQAHGFAHALAHMLPEAEVQSFEAAIVRNQGQIATVADLLAGFDVVFTQRFTAGEMEQLATPALRARCRRLALLPRITFPGYHPDMIYLAHEGRQYASPVRAYHSAIAAAGFALGLDEAATLGLFNRFVYGRLGYFEEFARARLPAPGRRRVPARPRGGARRLAPPRPVHAHHQPSADRRLRWHRPCGGSPARPGGPRGAAARAALRSAR
jgi:hypothetical protein